MIRSKIEKIEYELQTVYGPITYWFCDFDTIEVNFEHLIYAGLEYKGDIVLKSDTNNPAHFEPVPVIGCAIYLQDLFTDVPQEREEDIIEKLTLCVNIEKDLNSKRIKAEYRELNNRARDLEIEMNDLIDSLSENKTKLKQLTKAMKMYDV